ncbi:MAG: triphosphoribosyl-dephospho-CoA synthase [Methylococcales bacterium]|nr:triphosphoribosyl-dephospho-CoA synthase [Methylococcales bacterium]
MNEALKRCYLRACALDVEAFKPGNVGLHGAGHDMEVSDFLRSAEVSAPPLCQPDLTLGERIYQAVAATRRAVGCNTNLGIVLLAAPLLQALLQPELTGSLQDKVCQVLANTTVADADWVFQAITLANPGGLGGAPAHDVRAKPTVNLLEAMAAAAERDRIAWQYAHGYKDIFELGILRYNSLVKSWGFIPWAASGVYTLFLSRYADSHVQRKFGAVHNHKLARQFSRLDQALMNATDPEALRGDFHELDVVLKQRGINPGTSADLTVATALTQLLSAVITDS